MLLIIMMMNSSLNTVEKKVTLSLSFVYGMRMFGLFMVLPIFSIYAEDLRYFSPLLLGIAMGSYGLAQALLQIPFGLLSDRIGRKPLIYLGLCLFLLGALICAVSDTIFGVIIGRFLQGSGAISAVILTLAADLTRDEQRTKVMAVIGMTIGLSFYCAVILSPFLVAYIGFEGIFLLSALLAVLSVVIVKYCIPNPLYCYSTGDTLPILQRLAVLMRFKKLLYLNVSIFVLHFFITYFFVIFPQLLLFAGIDKIEHGYYYLLAIVVSLLFLIILILFSIKKKTTKYTILISISCLLLSFVLLCINYTDVFVLQCALILFFIGLNYLEAIFPSLVSQLSPLKDKGTAMGIYSTCQFLGAALGGTVSGLITYYYSMYIGLFLLIILAVCWFIFISFMKEPELLKNVVFHYVMQNKKTHQELIEKLYLVSGLKEVMVILENDVIYVKMNKKTDLDVIKHLLEKYSA